MTLSTFAFPTTIHFGAGARKLVAHEALGGGGTAATWSAAGCR